MQHKPAKQEEHHHAAPEYPLVLLCPALDLSDGIAADAERIAHAVKPALRVLEHVALLAKVVEHGAPAVQELVELRVCLGEKGLFSQRMRLAVGGSWACAKAQSARRG